VDFIAASFFEDATGDSQDQEGCAGCSKGIFRNARVEHAGGMSLDPAVTNPEHYKVIFENDKVRVLEYTDQPGDQTTPHEHPDSVMYTLSSFRRRLVLGDMQREVELDSGTVGWIPAQKHHGENIGDTPSHALFVELKPGSSGSDASDAVGQLGPE
jgi:hypothetical protein